MKETTVKGSVAEQMVAEYMRRHGCIIFKMNYRSRYGEIDIIAETPTNILFVEVKMRREGNIVSPAEAVDYGKRLRILQTAKDFLSKTHLEELQPRFDVAEVFYETDDNNEKHYKLHYIKNAFGE